jgi:hypothetical protein
VALVLLLDAGGPQLHVDGRAEHLDRAGLEAAPARAAAVGAAPAPAGAGPLATPVPHRPQPTVAYRPDLLLQAPLPSAVLVDAEGFTAFSLDGHPVRLDAHRVGLLSLLVVPRRGASLGPDAQPGNPLLATEASRDAALAELCRAGLVGTETSVPYRSSWEQGRTATRRIHPRTRTLVRQQAEVLDALPARGDRVPVFGVERGAPTRPPLALGLLFAAARAHRGGALEDRYRFVPDWTVRPGSLRRCLADGPAVFLFSDYVWSRHENLELSARVKELSPESLVVHGGPDVPKFPGDRERWFADHPSVDVAVHGEGEVALAEVLEALDGRLDADRAVLADVAGITYRPAPGAEPVTTAERPRLADLDVLPSPYLTGLFDPWKRASLLVTIETNRGCPYGCTFCDWGSATASRIRKFDLDRVFAEIDWAADAEAPMLYVADANFGIFERDVAIAAHIARRKAERGFPERVMVSYAKNTVKHLEPIVRILAEARLDVNGNMSVQSFDPEVLRITKRRNLDDAQFDTLAARFRDAQMPMLSDLMIGLPGATRASTLADLQGLVDHEVNANVHPTQLLPNAPMNEPSYRERWAIEADEHGVVRATASYSRDDRAWMDEAVAAFAAAEIYGILRQVLRWVAARTGEREVDVLEALRTRATADPAAHPLLAYVLTRFLETTTPPGPWSLLLDEVEAVVAARWGLDADDPEWQAVRTLQVHVLPDRGRAFPDRVELAHDVPAWLADRARSRRGGPAPGPLSTYPPAVVEVTDPHDTCGRIGAGHPLTDYHSFELAWPMARHVAYRWAPD